MRGTTTCGPSGAFGWCALTLCERMKREEFKAIVVQALEQLVSRAEQKTGQNLSRSFCFRGLSGDEQIEGDIAEALTSMTFVDEDHIFPCFDLFLEDVMPGGRLLLNRPGTG